MKNVIEVENKEKFYNKIQSNCKNIGHGAEGNAYEYNRQVIKLLNEYDNRKHTGYDYLQFSKIKTNYIYFTRKIVVCNEKIIAVITDKCPGKNLLNIDPLYVNIDKFIEAYSNIKEETITLSNRGIFFFDVPFNCMYSISKNKMGIIDTAEFYYSNEENLLTENLNTIQKCYLDFIIEGIFNDFILKNNNLNELYKEIKNKNINVYEEFLKLFKKELSENCGKDIITLQDASKVIKLTNACYPRFI